MFVPLIYTVKTNMKKSMYCKSNSITACNTTKYEDKNWVNTYVIHFKSKLLARNKLKANTTVRSGMVKYRYKF